MKSNYLTQEEVKGLNTFHPMAFVQILVLFFFPGCRTGEAKLTKGFNLAARFIIHTVGPKYKSRYRTAAESSLYSCYRNVLQLAK